jgi:putative inorganic carbon (HCO3(-)) transporter
MSVKPRWRALFGWLADWQIVPVALLAPIFMLPDRFPDKVVALAALILVALWLIYRLGRGHFFTPTPVDVPLLLLLATLPIGVWVSSEPDLSVPSLLRYLYGVTLFYALVNSLTTRRKIEVGGYAVLAGTALLAGWSAVGTAWSGSKFLPFDLAQRIPHLIGGFWYSAGFNPNLVGGSLAILVPITAAYAWAARGWPRRSILGLAFVTEAGILILTQSRGAVVGFAAALVVVAIGRDRRWAWALPVLALLVVLGVAIYGVQPSLELVMDSVGDSAISGAEGRLELFSRGLYMLQDFSFTGVGLGMFPKVLPLLYPLFLVGPDTEVPHVHNIYLQAGIDHGLPGLIAFLALILLLGVMGVQAIRHSRGQPWEPLAIGLSAGFAAFLIHGLMDAIWYSPRAHPVIWGCWGLLAAIWCWARSSRPPAEAEGGGEAEAASGDGAA